MLFKRRPKPPLVTAIHMVNDAIKIAYRYQHDRKHMPDKQELFLLDMLAKTLFRSQGTVERIARNMHQRARGEPEGSERFTNPDHPWA